MSDLPSVSNCVGCGYLNLCVNDVLASTCSNPKIKKLSRAPRGTVPMCMTAQSYCQRVKDKNE